MKVWKIVRCTRCGHEWDEEDLEASVCACILNYGQRSVVVVASGASNADAYLIRAERL